MLKIFSKNTFKQLIIACAVVAISGLLILVFSALVYWADNASVASWINFLTTMVVAILLIFSIFILLAILFPDTFDDSIPVICIAGIWILIGALLVPKITFTILNFIIILIVFAWLDYKFQSTRIYNFVVTRWTNSHVIIDRDSSGFYLWLGRAIPFFYYGSIVLASLATAILFRYDIDIFFNILLSLGYFAAIAVSFFLAAKSAETSRKLNNRASIILFIFSVFLFFALLVFGTAFIFPTR